MWKSCASAVNKTLNGCNNLRFARLLHAPSNESYLHHPGSEPLAHTTLSEQLVYTVNRYPDRIALRSVYEDLSLTYDQLLTQADALGCALRAQGLEKGDRLAIWSHNTAAWVVGMMAAARTGIIAVLINPVYEKSELSYCLRKTGVKGILISENLPTRDYYGKLSELIPGLQDKKPGHISSDLFPELTTIISASKENLGGTFNYAGLLEDYARQDASKYSKEVGPQDGCLIYFTSGSTGNPKAVLDSNMGVANNIYFIGKRNIFNEAHHNVGVQSPLFHALGSIVTLLSGFSHGCTVTLAAPTYNVPANVDALYSQKCTTITGTPTMFIDMLSQVKAKGIPPPDLKIAMSAGAPCSPQLIRHMQKYLNVQSVKCLYGLSESTACIFQSMPDDSVDTVAETVGYLQDHLEVKVVDDKGQTVPFGSAGELLSRGYNNMLCYWLEPEKTRETLSNDGWLSTGDEFKLSKDGYGRIVGRIKDIIVKGGENIAPKEIEDVLNTHPDITDSQVVGISDDRLGEDLCAVLRVKPGCTVTAKHIADHLAGKLARFKIPKIVKYVDEYPKTASGKVQKFKLRNMIDSGKL
ncbi:unnamed protein product [Chilo suppressalis]|uniref:Medium-chain acyl-CoA ligase ACSF2, mitochondrial n=1 Tax=Chilo suppressalis TaxID=168631 RepID=A0ABN8BIK4_CHISP|nr:unnamed protein product [Chilo suppressalis]